MYLKYYTAKNKLNLNKQKLLRIVRTKRGDIDCRKKKRKEEGEEKKKDIHINIKRKVRRKRNKSSTEQYQLLTKHC